MRTVTRNLVLLLILMTAASVFSGCNYLKNRGNDALDIADTGFIVNPHLKPQFGLYFDFFTFMPLGYSDIEAKGIGLGNRHAGYFDYTDERWGVLAWGSWTYGNGEFDATDPHQARDDQRDLTERPSFNTGFVRQFTQGEAAPLPQHFGCERMCMLGWIGFHFAPHPGDIVDFLLGWTTLDIFKDDVYGKEDKPKS
jgi:hypothetical protein